MRTLDLGLQRFTRRVSEAAQGTGEAQSALEELGLDARDLAQLAPDQAFLKVADAFEQVGAQADRVRLGFKLFDSEGVGLVNTLAAGRDGLQDFRQEAERLGLTLSGPQLAGIQNAADAAGRVRSAFSGLGQQLAATFAPAFETAANAIANFVGRITASLPSLAAFARGIFGIQAELNNLSLADLRAEANRLQIELDEVNNRVADNARFNAQTNSNAYAEPLARARAEAEALNTRLNDIFRRIVELRNQDSAAPAPIELSNFANATSQIEEIRTRAQRIADPVREFAEQVRRSVDPWIAVNEQLAVAKLALEDGFITDKQFEQFTRQLVVGVVGPLKKAEDEGRNFFKVLEEFSLQAARNIQTSFADFLFDPFEEGLDGLLRSFSDTLRRMVAELLAQRVLTQFLQSISNLGGPVGSFAGQLLGSFGGARASGGPVSAGRAYVVGERGPELFAPARSGSIIPNGSFGGGTTVNVYSDQRPDIQRRRDGSGNEVIDVVFNGVMQRMTSGAADGVMRERFGLTPTTRRL
ncbi:MAG: hypothetical protein AAFX44_06670 [Pseudomonadota bacterium]